MRYEAIIGRKCYLPFRSPPPILIQMRYGSIGWSVGAALGYAFASGPKSRALSAVVPNGLDMAEEVRRRPLVNPEPSTLNGSPQTLPPRCRPGCACG